MTNLMRRPYVYVTGGPQPCKAFRSLAVCYIVLDVEGTNPPFYIETGG